MKNFLLTLFILLSLSPAIQAKEISEERGYVSFDNLEADYGEPKVMINLNQSMLGFVSKLSASDPEVSELISKLKAVRVQIYSMNNDDKPALDLMTKVAKDIKNKNWMPIVTINEKKEKVRIFTKLTGEIMDGLVVMIINEENDKKEAVFINIIGEIDPEKINKVTDALQIDTGL